MTVITGPLTKGANTPMATKAYTDASSLPFAGYVRVSRVNGRSGDSFVSPELQAESIARTAQAAGVTLGEVVQELDVSGGKDIAARELGQLVAEVEEGRLGGIIVWNVKRYSRAWLDGLMMFERIVQAGGRLIAEDFQYEGPFARSILSFLLEGAQEERRQKTETWARVVAGSIERGVHSGSIAPLGYDWPRTPAGKKSGPLVPTSEAPRVTLAFERFADGATWRQVVETLGVRSAGAARNVLVNRVYLGEARSGQHVKPNAHRALVDEATFARVQRLIAKRAKTEPRTRGGSQGLLARVLRCPCGHSLVFDGGSVGGKGGYRCKSLSHKTEDGPRSSISAHLIEPLVLDIAKTWHAQAHPEFALTREVEDAMLPELYGRITEAEQALAEVDAMQDSLDVVTFAKTRSEAVRRLDVARAAVEQAEAGRTWLALTPERVAERLDGADTETVRQFVSEFVRVTVLPAEGRRRVPVEERVEVERLIGGEPAGATILAHSGMLPFGGEPATQVTDEDKERLAALAEFAS